MSSPYQELRAALRRAAGFGSIQALALWDQETYMPRGGGGARAEQLSLLAEHVHALRTSPRIGELIGACEKNSGLGGADRAAVREMRRDYDQATRLPGDLVAEMAKVSSQSQEAWKGARERNDFAAFAPWLEKMVALQRRKAECLGFAKGGEAYDALLDQYEPGATSAQIEAVFTPLRGRLAALIAELAGGKRRPDTKILTKKIVASAQHEFGLSLLKSMGFDLDAGRLDTTTHPFCEGLSPGDTRLTTRYRDEKFTDAMYGTLHEMGHGLYEQGLPKAEHYGSPLGEAISLGIHESQSRLWENFVGRSKPFWKWALPRAKKALGRPLANATLDQMYAAVNTATPTFIRVEADEATYNLHIMLRFEMERGLISGNLAIKDVPGVWNQTFKRLLGVEVPDDRRGCLQDVHWSFGLFGYFPTYTLGNLYAAQFWASARKAIPGMDANIAKGQFAPLLGWLRENIHRHGRRYRADELCKRVTGRDLSADPLIEYLQAKLRPLHGIKN